MTKNVIGYSRVSSEEQVNNYSLKNQEDKCISYCKEYGYSLLKIFKDEGKSATNINRPALLEMLEYCRKNKGKVDTLIIYKIDRLSRNTADYLEIKSRLAKSGVNIISITEPMDNSPAGEFLETILAAQARLDNAMKSARTKDGMTKRLEAGLPTNPVPVGYKYQLGSENKNIPVPDEPNFSLMQQGGYEYLKGIYTKQQIAQMLNKKGFKTKRGANASSQFVSHYLSNPFYKGVIISKVRSKEYPGKYQKMFSEEEWFMIQQVSKGKSFTAKPKQRNHPDFPLRHFIRCGKCGEPLTGSWSKGRNKKYAYYWCKNHSPSTPTGQLEDEFYSKLSNIKPKDSTVKEFVTILKDKYEKKYKELTVGINHLKKKLTELENTRKTLVKKNMEGLYDDDLFKEQDEDIKNQILVLKVQISDGSMEKLDIDTICRFAEHFIHNIAQTWKNADLETKQRLQKIIFPEGVTYHFPSIRTTSLSCLFKVFEDSGGENEHLGWVMGLEPITSNSTDWRSNQLSYTHHGVLLYFHFGKCSTY